ncbi:hypothetical protein [Flavobacterium sp.]|uniref:hypothetical protein n=1 Tax=Flavobacterium sp. TaxID=239 RepID=UPI003D11883B
MKKTILLLALFVLFGANSNAQTTKKADQTQRKALNKLNGNDVSNLSKNQFSIDFGKTAKDPKWQRMTNFDEVTFTNNGKKITAFYDEDSKLVGTTQEKNFTDIPAKAQTEITKKYKDYQKGIVLLFDDNEDNDTDMVIYGQQFDDEDSYFVEIKNSSKKIVLQVSTSGEVSYFADLK